MSELEKMEVQKQEICDIIGKIRNPKMVNYILGFLRAFTGARN